MEFLMTISNGSECIGKLSMKIWLKNFKEKSKINLLYEFLEKFIWEFNSIKFNNWQCSKIILIMVIKIIINNWYNEK